MAEPPDITDTFVREVDENLRRDQLQDFFKRYGVWLGLGLVLFIAAAGGLIYWQEHRYQSAQADVEQLAASYKEIGEELFISAKTVENHTRNILSKLHLSRKQELMRYALEHGID